jgi:hypothetical protein
LPVCFCFFSTSSIRYGLTKSDEYYECLQHQPLNTPESSEDLFANEVEVGGNDEATGRAEQALVDNEEAVRKTGEAASAHEEESVRHPSTSAASHTHWPQYVAFPLTLVVHMLPENYVRGSSNSDYKSSGAARRAASRGTNHGYIRIVDAGCGGAAAGVATRGKAPTPSRYNSCFASCLLSGCRSLFVIFALPRSHWHGRVRSCNSVFGES